MTTASIDNYGGLSSSYTSLADSLRAARRLALPWLDRATARVTADAPVLESLLSRIDPVLSLRRTLARVVEVRRETSDVMTFVLSANARLAPHRPGAFVTVRVTIDGRAVSRSYSLSSAPSKDGRVSITVKRVPGGLVSNHLCDAVAPGDILELSGPQGWFVLPDPVPAHLLMISAGSGITPMMSMLRQLDAQRSDASITFLHFARSPADVVFRSELEAIARRLPNVRLILCVEAPDTHWQGESGRFSEALLARAVPDYRNTETFLCGPPGFMKAVMQTFADSGADLARLRYEQFNPDLDTSGLVEGAHVVRFSRSGTETLASGKRTLLEEAEARGVRPTFGCRAGTCGTCRCMKKTGVVVNLATGRESTDGAEMIFPCVSVAKTPVELDL